MRTVQLVAGAAEDRAQAGARQEQEAGDRQEDAEDRRAGRAEPECDQRLEAVADETAVRRAERQQQARERDRQAELERPNVDEGALRDDQAAERDEDHRCQVRGCAERAPCELADRAAAEAEPEDGGEEHAERGEAEADQLRMLMGMRELDPLPRRRGPSAS